MSTWHYKKNALHLQTNVKRMNVFIIVRKVVDAKPAFENYPATTSKIELETIPLDDLISWRNWYKKGPDLEIDGAITQLTIISRGKDGGTYTMKINESEEELTERIKPFRPIINLA